MLDGGAGVDTALYASSGRPIAITYTGLSGSAGLKIVDGDGGIDTLSYMEKVIATSSRDTLKLVGNIANGTNLTIDANGGQSPNPRDTINTAEAGAGGVNIFIDPTSGAGYVMSNATTGKIGLVGFHTGIIGSEYDDTIIDLSTGRKEIMAGSGDDVVQVGVGSAFIDGGDGSDELRGGDGNDVLAGGEGTNILVGGAGSDLIKTSSSFQGYEMYYSDVGDVIDGGEGHDWISLEGYARSARGGPGNDVIDPTSGSAQVVYFRTGDGHDTVLASGSYSVSVAIEDVSMHDVTFIFEIKETGWITENDDSTLPLIYWMAGDLAVKINATGETIVIPNQGISLYHEWDLDGEHFTGAPNYYSVSWDSYVLSFSDGTIYDWVTENNMGFFDYGTPKIQFGSVASYKVAVENFNSAIAQDSHVEGGAGDDHLSGTGGSDAYSGGDGDDSIEASAGSDTIDGGAGDDELVLLGAEADYRFTRNADGSTLVASVGGGVSDTTFVNVEKVSFLADGTSVAIADLFTGLGTTGDDTLNGTHGDDQIVGLAGDDLISGGRGNDVIDGGDGVDTVTFTGVAGDYSAYRADNGSIGIESLSGTADYDTLINAEWIVFQGDGTRIAVTDFPEYGTSGSDTITGTVMAEDLYGDDGDDVLIGLGGSDDLDGGAGADTMSGGPGDDTYLVDDPGDSLIESAGEGFDRVYSIDTDFTLSAHVENLSLAYGGLNGVGNASDNEITGNYYGNYLQGLGGADVLISGGGSDTLDGGDGFDIAVFDFNSTNFTIVKSVDDSITISGFYGFWTSTLTNIELIRFSGDGVDIDTSLLDVTQMESPPPYNYYSVDHAYRSDRCPIMSPDILIV